MSEEIEEFFETLNETLKSTIAEKSLCGCGTCSDAFKTALRITNDMVNNDCPVWSIQVTVAMVIINRGVLSAMTLESPTNKEIDDLHKVFFDSLMLVLKCDDELREKLILILTEIQKASEKNGFKDNGFNAYISKLKKETKRGKT